MIYILYKEKVICNFTISIAVLFWLVRSIIKYFFLMQPILANTTVLLVV